MKTQIFLEGFEMDLDGDLSAEFTYSVDDIADFSSRNTAFSKTIVIPGSTRNNKLFGHIFDFGHANNYDPNIPNVASNFNASKAAQCVIMNDQIQIFKGVLRLLEIVIDAGSIEYECAVFGELGGFMAAVGNKKIEQIDFGISDHVWNRDQITESWDNVSGGGVYYPLIDFGRVSHGGGKNDWNFRAFRPALYVKQYIDKIITGSGYSYECDFFNTDFFERLIIPSNTGLSRSDNNAFFANANVQTYTTNNYPAFTTSTLGQFSLVGNVYRYNGTQPLSGNLKLRLYGQITDVFPNPAPATNVIVSLQKNGTNIAQQTFPVFVEPWTYFVDFDVPVTLVTNDTINAFVSSTANVYNVSEGRLAVESSAVVIVPVNYNETFSINSTIPKGVFQKDFFASIVKMFNLYVTETPNKSKHLVITPYSEYYLNQYASLTDNLLEVEGTDLLVPDTGDFLLIDQDIAGVAILDWTNKLDRSKPIRVKPMAELNGRYFEYKYKSDGDFYNDQYQKKYGIGYGDFIEDTGFEFANDVQKAEIIFAATPLVGYNGQEKVFPTIFKLSNANVEDQTEHVIRIMQAKKIEGLTNTWHIRTDFGNAGSALHRYGYAGHLDDPDNPLADINFGAPKELFFEITTGYPAANLFNSQWSEYIAEITDKDSKLLSANIMLNPIDVFQLDFRRLVYIDGNLWRLNRVIDFNPNSNESTKCEFLKVINLTY
jgi:hypothetical protein